MSTYTLNLRGSELVLIASYSFYGFPSHYYQEKYPNVGSKEVAHKVLELLKSAGIEAQGVKRGLDHGVWASFKCGMYRVKNWSDHSD